MIAEAATQLQNSAENLVGKLVANVLGPITGFLGALAIAFFLFGVLQFIMNSENEDGIARAKKYMMWGLIGLFIMISAWGVIGLIQGTISSAR
jgi:FtsH-binding integral membrane protein